MAKKSKSQIEAENKLSHDRVLEVFNYDPQTGILIRKIKTAYNCKEGKEAGWTDKDGYRRVAIDGYEYAVHRIIWLYVTGAWPTEDIDHHDCDRSNNRWTNLRPADQSQQVMNSTLRKDNTSGAKGVSWSVNEEKWQTGIAAYGKRYSAGYFDDFDEAVKAVENKRTELHKEFARSS